MKYYFTYKTTNLANGKCYIGVHSTKNLNDGYIGSGYKLQSAIKKYGRQNFKSEPIQFFNSMEDAYKHEAELVNEDWVKSKNNYNTTLGGLGGFYHIDVRGENNPNYGKEWSNDWKVEQSKRMKEYYQKNKAANLGRKFSEEWKNNISETRIINGIGKGSKNPKSYGNVKVIDLSGNELIFDTAKEASIHFKVDRVTLTNHCKNKTTYQRGKLKGYIFELTNTYLLK
jgi:hypothetical protein